MGVFTETVVPIIGNFLATAMLGSPIPAVLRIRSSGRLGDTNPLPYPMTVFNCAGWVGYAFATRDPYIFPANIIGFLFGIYFTLTAFPYATKKMQDRMTAMMVFAAGYIIMLGLIASFGLSREGSERLWGTSSTAVLMLYYFVPLSTIVAIVRTRNAASIYPPLAATAIANGLMWTTYGFAVQDINLWLPNLFGAIIGAVQFVLRIVYGARPTAEPAAGPAAGGGAHGDEEAAAFAKAHAGVDLSAGGPERITSESSLLPPFGAGGPPTSAAIVNGRTDGALAGPAAPEGSKSEDPLAAKPAS